MFTTLNIVIGLVFVLLLFSLLTSTVMEVVAAFLSLRGKHLRFTLETMLDDKVDDFLRHPFFRQLSYATNRGKRISPYALPAWLSKGTFRDVLLDILRTEPGETVGQKIQALPEGELKKMLSYLHRQAGEDLGAFSGQIESWFDEVMDRASDWYKRDMKWWLFGVGFTLAVIFNADTIQIYQTLSTNAVAREYLVKAAEEFADTTNMAGYKTDTTGLTPEQRVEKSLQRLNTMLTSQVEPLRSPLGLGWISDQSKSNLPWWLVKIAGLLLTGIAVTFGAPFWFDLLKKLIAFRSGGKTESAIPSPLPSPPAPTVPANWTAPATPKSEKPNAPIPSLEESEKPVG
jgi:hypothetical protein